MGLKDIIILIIICVIIGSAYYLKIYKPQQDAKAFVLLGEEAAEEQAELISDNTEYKPPSEDQTPQPTIDSTGILTLPQPTIDSTGILTLPPPEYKTKDTKFTTAQGLAISIAPAVIYKVLQTKIVKAISSVARQTLLRQASWILKQLGKKLGSEALMRAGAVAGKKAAAIATKRIAARAAAVGAAKMATATAGAATTAAATGPFAPAVFAAEMAFIALTVGLDLGDAGGYLRMTTNNMYVDMKKDFDEALNKALIEDSGLSKNEIPIIIGPFTKIAKLLDEERDRIFNSHSEKLYANNDPIFDKMKTAILRDIENGTITQSEFENNGALQDQYVNDNVNINLLTQKIINDICISNGGKMVKVNGIDICSYKDKETCEKSYTWPLEQLEGDEAPKDEYAEYKNELLGGLCILSNPALRSMCELNGLNYNMNDGLCRVTEKYCKTKGADWKNNDCHINKGQEIAELLFGTTITRGLKQIFDPKQYEPCLPGETDDGYFCRKVGCPDGEEQYASGGLCYPKCKDGFWASTANICAPKTAGVPAATTRNTCPPGSSGTTAGMCMDHCRSGHRNIGGVCYRDCNHAYGPGFTDIGVSCFRPLVSHAKKSYTLSYGKGCCCAYGKCCSGKCPSNYHEEPCTCRKKDGKCDAGYRNVLGVCWPDCDKVYGADFADSGALCSRPAWTRAKISYVPRSFPALCPSNKQDVAALCYNNCQPNYKMHTAGVCTFNGTTYGRGAGTVAVKIRAKKRLIPFSTKNN